MKIIHISDLHLDAVYKQENYIKTLLLLEYIADSGFDHVVITGDITENAERPAFLMARNLLKKFNLLNPHKCTIIIGNHDIFGGVLLAEDILNYPKKCRLTNFNNKVSEFTSAFNETYTTAISANTNDIYPFVKEFDEFILLGLNTIAEYSLMKNPFASNGKIPDEQLKRAFKILNTGKFKNKKVVVLAHHHFCKNPFHADSSESSLWQKIEKQTMKLRNKKTLLKFFNEINAELVLHGHLHETTDYTRKNIKFLNAGGTILGTNKNLLDYNIIEISAEEIKHTASRINLNTDNQKTLQYSSKGLLYSHLNLQEPPVVSLN